MGEIDELLRQVESLARQVVPTCLELVGVTFLPPEPLFPNPAPFEVVLAVARRNDDPEPPGWVAELASRVRARWPAEAFQLVVREKEDAEDECAKERYRTPFTR